MPEEKEKCTQLSASSSLYFSEEENCHVATKNKDVNALLRSEELTVEYPFRASRQVFGKTMLDSDEEKQITIKKDITPYFSKKNVDEYENSVIRPTIRLILEESTAQSDSIDFNQSIAQRIPTLIIMNILGLDYKHEEFILNNLSPLVSYIDNPSNSLARATKAKENISSFLNEIISANHEYVEKKGLIFNMNRSLFKDTEEMISTCIMLLSAGMATTIASLNILILEIYKQSETITKIKDCPENLLLFINETLRITPPLHETIRFARNSFQYEDSEIKKNEMVKLHLASANNDEAQYEHPDLFNHERNNKANCTFGKGRHACIGSYLAIKELQVFTQEILPLVSTYTLSINDNQPQLEGSVIKMYKNIFLKK